MAEAVASAIATAVVATGGTITATQAIVAAYTVIAAATLATTAELRQRREEKARAAFNAGLRDRYVMVRDALTPRTIVMGRQRVSGPMVFAGSYGTHKENLVFVVPVAGHEIDGFEDIYWGNERLDIDEFGTVVGIRREEVFSISVASNSYTLQGKAKPGSVVARARYGGEVDTLTASLASNGLTVTVSGARAGTVGQLTISYNPDPDPFYLDTRRASRQQEFVGTGSSQTVTLSPPPIPGSTVFATSRVFFGDEQPLTVSVSGGSCTFTAPGASIVNVTWQAYGNAPQRLQVRRYTGGPGQVADSALIAALPGVWTSAHRFTRTAYLVIEAKYAEDAFPSGIENVSAVIRGLKPYDARTNRIANYALAEGAVAGTPGTLPTGWAVTLPPGLTREVRGFGTDDKLGLPYVDLVFNGTHTGGATDFIRIDMPQASLGATALDAQQWSGRVRLRSQSGTWAFGTNSRVQLTSWNAANSRGEVDNQEITSAPNGTPIVCNGTISRTDVQRVSLSVRLDVAAGQSVNVRVRVMLPQLWRLGVGGANDPERWSENPCVLGRAYAVHPFGGRLPWSEVDHEEIRVSGNVCDTATTYTVGGADYVSPLYRLGYVARCDQVPTAVLDDICQAMNGQWVYAGGKLRLMAGYYRTPTVTIDESWLVGDEPITGAGRLPYREHVNAFDGSFVDEAQAYQNVPYTKVAPQVYLDQDREEFLSPEDFAGVPWHGQVQYIAACRLRRARQGYTLVLRCNWRALRLETGDVVFVPLARIGALDKPFEVIDEPTFEMDSLFTVRLRETSATIWDIDAGFPAIDFAPNTTLQDPWDAPEVQGFDAFSGAATLLQQADGTVLPRFSCEWTAFTDPRVTDTGFVEVRWGAMRDPVSQWQTRRFPGGDVQGYLDGLVEGQYYAIEARSVTTLAESDWTPQIRRLASSKEAPPANVTGLSASVSLGQVDIRWDQNTERDYLHTELRIGGTDWASATFLWRGAASSWAWPRPANATYVIRAKHVDRSRNPSTGTASVSVTVGDSIDGPAAVEIRISRSTITIKADTAGVIPSYSGATTTIDVFENGVDRTSSWTITRTDGANVDTTLTGTTTRTLTVTALTADTATVTLTFARSGYATQTRTVAVERLEVLTPIGVVSNLSMSVEDSVVDPLNATAGYRLNRDGSISVRNRVSGGVYITSARRWHSSTSSTIGDDYYVKFTQLSGDAPDAGTLNTWQRLNTARLLELDETIPTLTAFSRGSYGVSIAETPGGDSLGSGTLNLTAIVEPDT